MIVVHCEQLDTMATKVTLKLICLSNFDGLKSVMKSSLPPKKQLVPLKQRLFGFEGSECEQLASPTDVDFQPFAGIFEEPSICKKNIASWTKIELLDAFNHVLFDKQVGNTLAKQVVSSSDSAIQITLEDMIRMNTDTIGTVLCSEEAFVAYCIKNMMTEEMISNFMANLTPKLMFKGT